MIQENQNYCEYENYCRWLDLELVRKPIFRRNRQTILAIRDVIFVEDYRAVLYACVEKETPGGFKTQLISWLIFQNDFKSRFGRIGVEITEQKKTNERHGAMVDE